MWCTFQAVDIHPDLNEAAQGMKEAVRELGETLEEAASDSGVVTGLIDSIGKALAEVNSHFSYMHQQFQLWQRVFLAATSH